MFCSLVFSYRLIVFLLSHNLLGTFHKAATGSITSYHTFYHNFLILVNTSTMPSSSNDWGLHDFDGGADLKDPHLDERYLLDYALRSDNFISASGGVKFPFDCTEDHMLYMYNWYYHYCRVETVHGPHDGRPEEDRLKFRHALSRYLSGELQWPEHIDRYYFDLERKLMLTDAAVSEVAPPTWDEWYLPWTPYNPVDVERSKRYGFGHLADVGYDDFRGDDRTRLLAAGGLWFCISWDYYLASDDMIYDRFEGDKQKISEYLVERWCAIYKCCQVRVDDGSLEDGRTPWYRRELDTDHMMGYFSTESRYHLNDEDDVDKDGYTPLPTGLHRIQILHHREWLRRRNEEGLWLGLEEPNAEGGGDTSHNSDSDATVVMIEETNAEGGGDTTHNSDDDSIFSYPSSDDTVAMIEEPNAKECGDTRNSDDDSIFSDPNGDVPISDCKCSHDSLIEPVELFPLEVTVPVGMERYQDPRDVPVGMEHFQDPSLAASSPVSHCFDV